ncbi:HEAT repeat domain-containing protein [bacterium]|nr:HEAT repeat domain-containing protein [bacterium]
MTGVQSQSEEMKSETLTQEEALELATTLKQKLSDGEIPSSDLESINRMVAGLGDNRGELRLTFAKSLGSVGEDAIPILCEALKNSPNIIIRRASAKTLNIIGDKKALPNLIKAFETDEDPVVQGSSAGAMATIGEPSIQPLLKILTETQCTAFQIGLINLALGFIGSKSPMAFHSAVSSTNPEIRIAALSALAEQAQKHENTEVRLLILNALKDSDSEVRAEAATIIGKSMDQEEAANQLHELLRDENDQVRKNTALSLMKMESVISIDSIENAILKESDEQVKGVLIVARNQLINRRDTV